MGIADDNKACINAKDFRKHKKRDTHWNVKLISSINYDCMAYGRSWFGSNFTSPMQKALVRFFIPSSETFTPEPLSQFQLSLAQRIDFILWGS